MDDLGKLKLKRGQIKAQLTRNSTYLNTIDTNSLTNIIVNEISIRMDRVEPLLSQFEEIHSDIAVLLNDRMLPSEDNQLFEFESDYFQMISKMKTIISDFNQIQCDGASTQSGSAVASLIQGHVHQVHQQIKLPEVRLPKFNGSYDRWLEFRDSFIGLVKNNSILSNVEKFYYLKSFLEGEALQIIASIEISNDNFDVAWSLLLDRYENKRLIVFNYVKSLFDVPALSKESNLDLRKLYDLFNKNLRALKSLGQETDKWDTLIIHLLTSKFDAITRREWESHKINDDLPTMADINTFLKTKCELLEKLEIAKGENKFSDKPFKTNKFKNNEKINALSVTTNNKVFKCYFCGQKHTIYKCDSFKSLDPRLRCGKIKQLKLCSNCFSPSHVTQNCNVKANCRLCGKRHNTLLHIPEDEPVRERDEMQQSLTLNTSIPVSGTSVITSAVSRIANTMTYSLLSTAVIIICDSQGTQYKARVLLDPGSQSNFITENLVNKLNLKRQQANYSVVGVGESSSLFARHTVSVEIKSRVNDYSVEITCLVIPKITQNIPIVSFDSSSWTIPSNVNLADNSFNLSGEIDMLIGVGLFYDLLLMEQICQPGMPVLQRTKLGWIFGGNYCVSNVSSNKLISCVNVEQFVNESLVKFWELEEVDNINFRSHTQNMTEDYCETHFRETHKRNIDGRFIVRIPFKDNVRKLGDSKCMAEFRLLALERKLAKHELLRKEYNNFMAEYLDLGHMTKVSLIDDGELSYYLPHHAVVKDSSLTTRVRVVFDASAKSDTGFSFNDIQHSGPNIHGDLLSIILRFRMYPFVINADISKMYRQILVDKEDRRFQKILWRNSPSDEMECYELNTVTYGTASAPFLAIRCLHQLAFEFQDRYPSACTAILNDMYVDDLLTGSFSELELLKMQAEIFSILSSGGFELRKWLSNKHELLSHFQVNQNSESSVFVFGAAENNKTLGIFWNSISDTIQYSIRKFDNVSKIITKRIILSIVSQIFDPLGLLGPIIITAKILLQVLWQEKLAWDDEVSIHLRERWVKFCEDLYLLNTLRVPRHVLQERFVSVEIHGFADASEKAFGGCVYLRCLSELGVYSSRLLVAKSKVAPLKKVTLPRLELCAAVLLAKLVDKVQQSLTIKIDNCFFWSDSEIVLWWIKGSSSKWKTFVANRVAIIESVSKSDQWFHIRSEENPADCLSRGVSTAQLITSNLWWEGPSWLKDNNLPLDHSISDAIPNQIPEQRTLCNSTLTIQSDFEFSAYSSLTRLQRIIAYCFRAYNKMRKKSLETGPLTVLELDKSLERLVQLAQIQSFPREYNALQGKRPIPRTSNLLSLNPFLDKTGCLRVGGRVHRANISYNQRHPILLHNKHHLTILIVLHEHQKLLHCGQQQLLYAIRERFWPIAARSLLRKIVRNCVTCFKAQPATGNYLMGNLPESRVTSNAPVFSHCGLDYAGPIFLKDRKGRKPNLIKGYICLFICMSTKCMHLEVVSDLTSETFISALRRFIARRGRPLHIYSDNGTTFVGANAELAKFLRSANDKVNSFLSNEGINWHFIPPRAPNFGGLWEAGVKRIKYHLKRIMGNNNLTYEEFSTILTQIESIVNSRPLCPMSSDPNDSIPLTPAHFLIGKSLVAPPEPDYTVTSESRLTRYQYYQRLVQHFWQRWSSEYLTELQSRLKWKTNFPDYLHIGSLVMLKEDNLPPFKWKTARVIELHKGSDEVTRVVSVKCSDGSILRRSITKVCALPEENIFNNKGL